MKRIFFSIIALTALALTATSQTLNIKTGNVTTIVDASQAGDMTYSDGGQTLTVCEKAFSVSDIDQIYVDETTVVGNMVYVTFNESDAEIVVAGNIAKYLTITTDGAHVSIAQSDDVAEEICYNLKGSSSDGEFYMTGTYKATVELEGLTLTNPNGAAINIMNGKRIDLSVKKDTENTITDGSDGEQKAAIYCKGHLELKGKGVLNVYGNTAHAIKSAEYMEMKNCTVNVLKAVKDGVSCDQYFLMESGTLNISGVGDDGLQCDLDKEEYTGETEDHEDEDTGNVYILGGTINITTTAAGTKCMKADSIMYINGGTLTLKASGSVDTSDSTDPSYVAGISCGKYVQNSGTVTMTITGTAGRGVKAWDIETNDGELSITNSGAPTTISSDVKGAKGLKALNMALNGGTITITMSGNASKAIRCGDGTKSTSGSSGGGNRPGGGGGGGGTSSTKYTNVTGSYTQGLSDGTGPTLKVTQNGSAYSSSSAKAIKAICAITLYGGQTEVYTYKDGAEGLESKTSIDVQGGNHYFKCYDDCINSAGKIYFNGGITVCWSTGNDAIDSNAGTTGAITIGNGAVFAYTTKGSPEEGIDCDNNSYIQITGTGYGISAGASQGGSSSISISNAKQGYYFYQSSSGGWGGSSSGLSFKANTYYTLADASGNNLITFSFEQACTSSLSLFTAKGMKSGSSYNVKGSSTAPTDATSAWHGIYLGSTAQGTGTALVTMTAK